MFQVTVTVFLNVGISNIYKELFLNDNMLLRTSHVTSFQPITLVSAKLLTVEEPIKPVAAQHLSLQVAQLRRQHLWELEY